MAYCVMELAGHAIAFLQQRHSLNLRGILLQDRVLLLDQGELLPDGVDSLCPLLQEKARSVQNVRIEEALADHPRRQR
ncbi:hypothetical protein D3C75_1355710 [compost metagenome]